MRKGRTSSGIQSPLDRRESEIDLHDDSRGSFDEEPSQSHCINTDELDGGGYDERGVEKKLKLISK